MKARISTAVMAQIESKGVHTCEECGYRGAEVTEQPTHQNGHDTFAYLCTDYRKCTVLTIKCMHCGDYLGTKPGLGVSGVTSGCCPECFNEHYGNVAFQNMMVG